MFPFTPAAGWVKARPPITGVWTDSFALGDSGTTYGTTRTVTGQAIGTAAANRTVIACCTGIESSSGVASVTIGGIAATSCFEGSSPDAGMAFFAANVPTGTTATIILTFDASKSAAGCSLYAVYGLSSLIPVATASSTADPATSGSLNINNGVGIGLACPGNSANPAAAWTGFTEDADFFMYDAQRKMSTASIFTSGSVTATCDWTTPGADRLALFAVWR